jgi:hypothetical protein
MNRLRHWIEIAVDASGVDHTPVATFPSQQTSFDDARADAVYPRALVKLRRSRGAGFRCGRWATVAACGFRRSFRRIG